MICIYAIINLIDDKSYIGQASDKNFRWREHRKQLRGFYHHNLFLQRAWCKHGEHNFIFVVLEILDDASKLNDCEEHWGKLLNPEYNVAPLGGSMKGYKHSDEARTNMSKAQLGNKHSEETKAKMSASKIGNQFAAGQKQSAEHIEARARILRGRPVSQETRDKRAASMKGRKFSEDTKRKMSEAAKRRWQTS